MAKSPQGISADLRQDQPINGLRCTTVPQCNSGGKEARASLNSWEGLT